MTTNVAVFLLRNGTYLIANYEELDEEPSCYLTNCFKIKNEDQLEEFPLYSFERDCLLSSSEFLTIFDPDEKILELYNKTIS
jgi:hypothetical protein